MNEPEPLDASQLDIELMRQIDAVCRRFEGDWLAGARRPLDDYLAGVPDQGQPRSGPSLRPWSASCTGRRRRARAGSGSAAEAADNCAGESAHYSYRGGGPPYGPRGRDRGAERSGHARPRAG